METPIPEQLSASEQPRRSACDRCRGQKLRCDRLSPKDNICRRCLRAGARCITTFSHRLNRARLSNSDGPSASSSVPPNQPQDHIDFSFFEDYLSPRPPECMGSPQVAGEALPIDPDHTSLMSLLSLPETHPAPNGPTSSSLSTADFFDFTQAVSSWRAESTVQDEGNRPTCQQSLASDPAEPKSPSSIEPRATPVIPFPLSPHRSRPQNQLGPPRQDRRSVSHRAETWTQRFSRMSAGLLEDLALIESGRVEGNVLLSAPPCPTATTTMTATTYVSTRQTGRHHYTIRQMLRSSDELLRALQEQQAPGDGDHRPTSGQRKNRRSQSCSFDVGESMRVPPQSANCAHKRPDDERTDPLLALLMLTCYTTLLRIYKGVMSLIRDSMPVDSSSGPSFEPSLPTVQLDGMGTVSQRTLQTRILLSVSAQLVGQIDEAMQALHLGLDCGEGAVEQLRSVLLTPASGEGSCDRVGLKKELGQICRAIQSNLDEDWEI